MIQTKLESGIEQLFNMGSGLLLSALITQPLAFAYLGYYPSFIENLQIAVLFVIFSIIRGYLWRRLYNKGIQSKLDSLVEQTLSTISGVLLSLFLIQPLILPLFGIYTDLFENLQMAVFFTFISIVRGYFWRRFFNKRLTLKILSNR